MRLIIEIPEKVYKKQRYSQYFGAWSVALQKCFENGISIPEGHDRMIILSEDAVKREQTPLTLNFSCQKWISEVGLSNATIATIEPDVTDTDVGNIESEDKE